MSYDSNESRIAEALDRIDSNLAELLVVIKDMTAESKAQSRAGWTITSEQYAAALAQAARTPTTPASDNSPPPTAYALGDRSSPGLAPSEQLAEMVTALMWIADRAAQRHTGLRAGRAQLALARCGLGYQNKREELEEAFRHELH